MFSIPPVYVSMLRQPEVMGLSASGQFVVTADVVALADVPALLMQLNVPALSSASSLQECPDECDPGVYHVQALPAVASAAVIAVPTVIRAHARVFVLPMLGHARVHSPVTPLPASRI